MPVSGTVQMVAESEKEAIRILTEAHAEMRNFRIIAVQKITEDEQRMLGLAKQHEDVKEERLV